MTEQVSSAIEQQKEKSETYAPHSTALQRITAIALNTFRESIRDKILYNLVFFVLLLTAAAIFLSDLMGGQGIRFIINMGLSATLLFGAFIAIFVGVGLVYKEIEKRTVYAIFAKPVGRGEFLVGKYLGLCLTLLVNVVVMGIGVSLALVYVSGGWQPLALGIWPAVFLIYVELTILTAVALFFSSFSSPALSALLTFFIFIIGHFSDSLKDMATALGSTGSRWFFTALYYVLPNLADYSQITPAVYGKLPTLSMMGVSLIYAAIYISILLAASTLIFSRRNFK